MKKNYLIIVLLMLLGYGLKGQTAPSNFINYQGVARDSNGQLLSESTINLGIGLRFGAENAPIDYQETHNLVTDANGVFSLRIGNGAATTGNYASLPWGSAAAFITVSINGEQLGTTEIMAVPYAISSGDGRQTAAEVPYDNTTSGLLASNAQEAIDALVGGGSINTDNQGLLLTDDVLTIERGTGSVDLSLYRDDEDADPTNELQNLSFDVATNVLSLSNGNTVTIPSGGTDADADPMNEIQDISLDGTELSITNGSTIDLAPLIPPGGTDNQNLILSGDVLSIEGGLGSVDLSTYINDADFDPLNEVDVTAQSGILLGDGTDVTGLVGTTDGQVPKWDATTSTWVLGTDETGGGMGTSPWQLNGNAVFYDNGNVGIGLTAPNAPLHVHQDAAASNSLYTTTDTGDGPSNGLFVGLVNRLGDGFTGEIINQENGPLYLGTNGLNRLRIMPNGQVSIGSIFPEEALDVEGTIRTRDLAGTGLRNVVADAEGNLVIGAGGGADGDSDPMNEIQDISLDGTEISITSGSTIDLAPLIPPGGSDDQNLELTGDVLSIEGGLGSVDLSTYIDDADADANNEIQDISLDGTEISITSGSTIDLAPLIPPGGSDDQNLELTGDVLSIEGGLGSVDLSAYVNDADFDPLNEVDVTAQTGILLGDGADVTGLVGTVNGQVPKWDATANVWVPGDDEVGTSGGGTEELNDLSDAITSTELTNIFIGLNSGISIVQNPDPPSPFESRFNTGVGISSLRNNTTGFQNTALGTSSLFNNLTGANNTAIGSSSLSSNTTGGGNTALGESSLRANTTGFSNTAVGSSSHERNTTGFFNTGIGVSSLRNNISGGNNTAVGAFSLRDNEIGSGNTALGANTLVSSGGSNLTAVGYEALRDNTTGAENTAVGYLSLANNTTGTFNTAVGFSTLASNTTGVRNTALGTGTLGLNTTGNDNTAVGSTALNSNTSGDNNIALGTSALGSNTTGNNNTAVGSSALTLNSTGDNNIAVGFSALLNNRTGTDNMALGVDALRVNQTGNNNTAVGRRALSISTVSNLTAVGFEALRGNTTGNFNTAVGYLSLGDNTTGASNTAMGFSALTNNTTGESNTALGASALSSNTTGNNNTAVGPTSLTLNTTGGNNVAVGNAALINNRTGDNNTVLGADALRVNQTGNSNTAVGRRALNVTTVSNLTAVGYEALRDNTTGQENTAIGYSSLTANTTGGVNTAVGDLALFNNTTGTENTAIGASTLANNTTADGNTAIGARALSQNIAQWNTAVGSLALTFNTTGINNTAVGRSALSNNTEGIQNTAVGTNALTSNTSGGNNTAIGTIALSNNTTGSRNTAFGSGALFLNESGENNSAIGTQALRSNTTGFENTAVGYDALLGNTSGIRNTAIGGAALVNNTAGSNNVAIGRSALFENTNGRNNTAVGLAALLRNIIGNDNTAVGFNALVNLTSGNNNTALGENAQVPNSTGSNQVRIGNTNISLAQIQVAWTVTSDQRWKTDIQDLRYGLNMVNQLRPVDYLRKNNNNQTRETGFIAQEVETVLKQLGYEDQGILTKDDQGYLSLRYNDFVPILTKAIQEQQSQIEGLRKANENMQAQLDTLQHMVNNLLEQQSK